MKMVKLESFDLRLDRFDCHYSAGDTVTGAIYLSVSAKHPVKIRELSVTLSGDGKTSWVNKVSDNIYDSTEPYLNLKQTFKSLLEAIVDSRGHLPPGQHRFPFKFLLPYTLPSSYEGEFGYVRYSCIAEVNMAGGDMQRATSFRAGFSSRNKKMTLEKSLAISAQVGLNQLSDTDPNNDGIRQEGGYDSTGCCGIGVGRINAAVSLPQAAFIIGQVIPVNVWIENDMRRAFHGPAMVSLVQDVHFRSVSFFQTASDNKVISKVIDVMQVDIPERGKEMTKTVFVATRPDLPATSISDNLISIRYRLKLEIGHFEVVVPVGLASKV